MLTHGFGLESVQGHESNKTWSRRARQEDMGTGAHNMGTCPVARFSLLSMLADQPLAAELGKSRQV